MDIHALRQWLIVIDNLMTNDKISFKELLGKKIVLVGVKYLKAKVFLAFKLCLFQLD